MDSDQSIQPAGDHALNRSTIFPDATSRAAAEGTHTLLLRIRERPYFPEKDTDTAGRSRRKQEGRDHALHVLFPKLHCNSNGRCKRALPPFRRGQSPATRLPLRPSWGESRHDTSAPSFLPPTP